jgi:hypothetical protein
MSVALSPPRAWAVGALLLASCAAPEVKADERPTAPPPGLAQGPRSVEPGARPVRLAGLLLPPAELGTHRSAVSGCAAESGQAPQPARGPEPMRAPPPADAVEVSGLPTGVVVTHEVPHACCLSERTEVLVQEQRVTIVERFEGQPCRCRCGSSIRTAVGLAPGSYTVEVLTVEGNTRRSAWSGKVDVR